MFYVYRFLDIKGHVIYIGQTRDLETRVKNHIESGHLPSECYSRVHKIEYLELPTRVDMEIVELYLINRYRPRYNTLDKESKPLGTEVILKEDWKTFESFDFSLLLKYQTKSKELEVQNKTLSKKYHKLLGVSKDVSDLDDILDPYYMQNLDLKLEEISKQIGFIIKKPCTLASAFSYKEVLILLTRNKSLNFESINKGLHIQVYREEDLIIFEDKNNTICEGYQNKYYSSILNENLEEIGSFLLAGIVPYLHYSI